VLSPLTTVFVLAVLWLIVVVPMVLRRNDEKRRDRTVDGFGRAMRALGRRTRVDADVFVPREHRSDSEQREPRADSATVPAGRRPIPAPEEALMYPVDRTEMSAARAQMMARRRRSLGTLIAGAMLFTLLAFVMGGVLWLLDAPFLVGTAGYLYFLRTQARRDRERRAERRRRADARRLDGFDATEEIARFEELPESVVRIDDDDIELHNLDTIDLTGLYHEEITVEAAAQRRAS
jgi:Flp pilus assembly protein TadB